ncbi:MAG TPA: hypothetical protein VKB35_20290 [Ktedonobacteraceae bacterium]|nr:hypothetical protein [Ktedonobacteraceae bacterium]
MSHAIGFASRWAPRWFYDLTGDHGEIDEPGQRSMRLSKAISPQRNASNSPRLMPVASATKSTASTRERYEIRNV